MKTNSIFLALLLVAFFAMSSCNSRTNNNNDYNDTQDTTMQGDDTVMGDNETMSPGEVLATVMAIDNNEINAAQEAQKKNLNQAVMDYAKMLESDHKDNLQKANSLAQSMNITTQESEDVEDLKQKGAQMLADLTPKDGDDFAKDYIDKMVKGHQDALDKIDDDLMPATTDSQLRDFLNQTRQAVANHLDRAKQLQDSM